MNSQIKDYLKEKYNISKDVIDIVEKAENDLQDRFKEIDDIAEYNQLKVLNAFHEERLASMHFNWESGYGLSDVSKDKMDAIFARVFKSEAAIVRPTIACGTHALASVYFGLLRPGDEIIYCTGTPYDTMKTVIGLENNKVGNLLEFGIKYKQVDLLLDNSIDISAVKNAINSKTKLVVLQRSTGYSFRKAFNTDQIKEWVKACKEVKPDVICMVDNCYGEFTDYSDPIENGADVCAGSLIKGVGGGYALSGGYVAGTKDIIDAVSNRLTAPGLGGEYGLTFGQNRDILRGLFVAPNVVRNAVKGAVLCSKVFESLGYEVCPKAEDRRGDIVTSVKLNNRDAVIAFCKAVQAAAPVDSFAAPEGGDMPGYADPIVMASGSFVQGSTIELSADGPLREPYIVYFQGGLTYEHSKFGIINVLQYLKNISFLI